MGVCQGHSEAISCLTHESNFLFSGSDDTCIIAWDLHCAQRTLGTISTYYSALRGCKASVSTWAGPGLLS